MPKVSVCIPSFNHEKYVSQAIDSVLAQSFQDLEIIVTDDGSTDRTVEEILQIRDKRVALEVLPRNCGVGIALNSSIRRSKGEYVAILNSDDLFLPGKLEQQVHFLDAHPDVGAVFAYPTFVDEAGREVADSDTFYRSVFRVENQTRSQWLRQFFMTGNALCHPTVLIRRRCHEEVGYYDPAFAQLHDVDMWVRLLQRYEIHVMKEALLGFRILANDLNASGLKRQGAVRTIWESRRLLEHYMTLDERLLLEAFPELIDCMDWSTQAEGRTPGKRRRPALWCLAELALTVGDAWHVSFALDAMYRILTSGTASEHYQEYYRELIRYTGAYDPYGLVGSRPNRRIS